MARDLTPVAVALLRVLASTSGVVPASRAFALTAVRVSAPFEQLSPTALAKLAADLDRLGMVLHLRDRLGLIHLSATPLARARLGLLDRRERHAERHRVFAKGSFAAGIATPLLASCAALAPRHIDPSAAPDPSSRPAHTSQAVFASASNVFPLPSRTAQVEVDGRLMWAVCHSPDECPEPTPKTRAVVIPAAQPIPAAVTASPVVPAATTPPAPPRFDSVSLFYAVGQPTFGPSEQRHFRTALDMARGARDDHSLRVFVVGMTDPTGSASLNAALAHRRAEAVRDLLSQAGVERSRISTQADTSASRSIPPQAVARPLPSDRFSQFRRVDIVISTRASSAPAAVLPAATKRPVAPTPPRPALNAQRPASKPSAAAAPSPAPSPALAPVSSDAAPSSVDAVSASTASLPTLNPRDIR